MRSYLVLFNLNGNWEVYHEISGNCCLCEDSVADISHVFDLKSVHYFVFNIDALCDLDVVSLSDAMYDWR